MRQYCSLLLLLLAASVSGQHSVSPPVLHVDVPQEISTIQTASPGVHIAPGYGGNVGVSYWQVDTPVHLRGGSGTCAFDLDLSVVPKGAATLSGTHGTIVDDLQIDSFGVMTAASAAVSAGRLQHSLVSRGWTPVAGSPQLTASQIERQLRENDSVLFTRLQCGKSAASISLRRDPRHPKAVTYDFSYH